MNSSTAVGTTATVLLDLVDSLSRSLSLSLSLSLAAMPDNAARLYKGHASAGASVCNCADLSWELLGPLDQVILGQVMTTVRGLLKSD